MLVGEIREVWDALEATAINSNAGRMGRQNASQEEIARYRDLLLRFLEEIGGDISVADLREALEEYAEG